MDRSVVRRFKPGSLMHREYLACPEGDPSAVSSWVDAVAGAHVFDSHELADQWKAAHPFRGGDERMHHGWAECLPGGEEVLQRAELTQVGHARKRAVPLGRRHVEPAEAFEILERRGLA